MMVAIFGTMAADGIRDGAGIPYTVTTPVFALVLAVVFAWWYRSEGTLSIHSITTRRRERFYWAAVLATFALGTAAGDLTAHQMHLGDPLVSVVELVFFIGLVAWVTISRRDVQAGHHHTATLHLAHHLAGHHDAEAHHHGLAAPVRLAAELE